MVYVEFGLKPTIPCNHFDSRATPKGDMQLNPPYNLVRIDMCPTSVMVQASQHADEGESGKSQVPLMPLWLEAAQHFPPSCRPTHGFSNRSGRDPKRPSCQPLCL